MAIRAGTEGTKLQTAAELAPRSTSAHPRSGQEAWSRLGRTQTQPLPPSSLELLTQAATGLTAGPAALGRCGQGALGVGRAAPCCAPKVLPWAKRNHSGPWLLCTQGRSPESSNSPEPRPCKPTIHAQTKVK